MAKSRLSFIIFNFSFVIAVMGCKRTKDDPQYALHNPESNVQFKDVTTEAGIQFRHVHGGSGEKYFVETMGSGAAFLDYDNDGDQDLYLVNSSILPGFESEEIPRNLLFRNEGDGTFTDITDGAGVGDTGYGMGAAVGDVNNDGYLDIYVTNFGPNLLYRNNGNGTFTDIAQEAGVADTLWGTSAAFADVDGDGFLDLYVCNYVDFTFQNHKFCSDAFKKYRSYCHPDQYNGVPDLLYRNNGDGTFSDVTSAAGIYSMKGKGLGVVPFDYDNDGDFDLYIANDSVRNFLYQNNGDGTFSDVALLTGTSHNEEGKTEAGMGTDFGDYDNDGFFDLFVTNLDQETNTLYHNEGGDHFTDASYLSGLGKPSLIYVGWGTNFFDYDNDGDADLFITNGHTDTFLTYTYSQRDLLFSNNGDGIFVDFSITSGEYFKTAKVGRGTAIADYDNDGDVDLFITNSNDTPNLLRNDGGGQHNWLIVKTVGTKSNRDGIGARIKVITGDLIQMDEVKSGSSYLCQNDLRLHFGLGKRKKVDGLEIRWPSGLVETYGKTEVNQILVVVEGEGVKKDGV
jgi:hypothetical protein